MGAFAIENQDLKKGLLPVEQPSLNQKIKAVATTL